MMKVEEIKSGDISPPENPRCVYENLGAPCLLYRHTPSYLSPFDAIAGSSWKFMRTKRKKACKVHETWQSLNRLKARWHYPLDQHYTDGVSVMEQDVLPPSMNDDEIREKRRKTPQIKEMKEISLKYDEMKIYNEHDTFDDPASRKRRAIPLLQTGRLTMLFADETDPNQPYYLMKDYTSFDHPYISAKYISNYPAPTGGVINDLNAVNPIRPILSPDRWEGTRRFAEARRNYADPSYLAEFHMESIEAMVAGTDETLDQKNSSFESSLPREYGNCILSLPCPCVPCSSLEVGRRSWCLFHPSGDLLDHICVSNITPPNGNMNSGIVIPTDVQRQTQIARHLEKRWPKFRKAFPNELDLDERVLEIKQSGSWDAEYLSGTFVVRTSTHISVLKVTCERPYEMYERPTEKRYHFDHDVCWGTYHVEEKNRIDLRSLSRSFPSYRPGNIACHPKYGNTMTPATFAFLSPSDSNELNVLHHVIDGETPQIIKHTIPCLKFISHIDFTSTNPMCLWAAAKSYVTPALMAEVHSRKPVYGHGTSLYSVDLRTDSATFQWSPSAEEHVVEGVHSISGIRTDWQRENTVWVSSVSAQKTYEIDTRMPCQVVNTWSLPFGCDEPSINLPTSALYGEGTLLVQPPQNCYSGTNDPDSPILSVDMTPGSFGFHLYQRPEKGPRFQTPSLECIDAPGLLVTPKASIATSSVFALPDASEKVFTCGITAARMHISQVIEPGGFEHFKNISQDTSVLCTVTITNKGDIYAHSLLENSDETSRSVRFVDLPIGTKAAGIPDEIAGKEATNVPFKKPMGGMNLKLRLENDYPMPGTAIAPSVIETAGQKRHSIKDLSGRGADKPTLNQKQEPLYTVNCAQTSVSRASNLEENFELEDISDDAGHIAMPLKLAEKPQKMVSTFKKRLRSRKRLAGGKNKRDESSDDESNSDAENLVVRRSDVSPGVLKASLDIWDDLENPTDDSEEEGGPDDDRLLGDKPKNENAGDDEDG
jgi:hypothetical protein